MEFKQLNFKLQSGNENTFVNAISRVLSIVVHEYNEINGICCFSMEN